MIPPVARLAKVAIQSGSTTTTSLATLLPRTTTLSTTRKTLLCSVPSNALQVVLLRGGQSISSLEFERVGLRLEGLDSYAVIASIVLGAILDVYQSCPKKGLSNQRKELVMQWVHAFCSMIASLSGLYVVMVFSLFNLYAKMALGSGADEIYQKLLFGTIDFRRLGFQAFLCSLVTFEIALVANFFLNFKRWIRWLLSGFVALGTVACLKEWGFIVRCASTYIFGS